MHPGEINPSVILDQYGEIDLLRSALNNALEVIPEELIDNVFQLIPNADAIMEVHERILPIVRTSGQKEPEVRLHLSESQVAVSSLLLELVFLRRHEQEPELSSACEEMQYDLAVNLEQSRSLVRINRQED